MLTFIKGGHGKREYSLLVPLAVFVFLVFLHLSFSLGCSDFSWWQVFSYFPTRGEGVQGNKIWGDRLLSKIRLLPLRGWATAPNNRILDRQLEFKPSGCHTPKSPSLYVHFPSWGPSWLIKNTNLYQIKAEHTKPTNWLVGTRANFYKVTQHVLISSEATQCPHLQRKPYLEAIR